MKEARVGNALTREGGAGPADRDELITEIAELRARLEEAEATLCAIRGGEVDAFVVHGPGGETIYTLGTTELLQQLRLITDVLPVLIAYVDRDGRFQFSNRQHEVWFGRPGDELQGRHLREVFGEEAWLPLRDQVDAALAGHKVTAETWIASEPLGARCLRATYVPHVHQGEVWGFVSLIEDVTERKRAEAEMLRAKDAAEAANRAKDQFLATLSHELRTPLTPVLAVTAGLERDADLPDGVRQGLAVIRRNVELEARLIDDLLDLTRIARGKLDLHNRSVDLREVIHSAVETCDAGGISRKDLSLQVELEAPDHQVWADPARLTQVFWNLLSNAIKFTPDGGEVRVRSSAQDGRLTVAISDTGIGIDGTLLEQIFDAFDQGQPGTTRQFGGLGLGLAISRAIVELHGGRIQAESPGPGEGATFAVTLPLLVETSSGLHLARRGRPARRSAPSSTADPVPSAPAPAPPASSRGLRILLVEDHLDTAEAMGHLLDAFGHRTTVAGTIAQALEVAEGAFAPGGEGFDLVISDLGLPDGTGQELMKQLSQSYQVRGLALSGYGMEEDVQRSQEAGFSRHLTKPVSPDQLEKAVWEIVAPDLRP